MVVCLDRNIVHALVLRRGTRTDSERPENLPRIAVVMSTDLCNEDIAFLDNAIRLVLSGYTYGWIVHRRCRHVVNMGFATQTEIGTLNDGSQFVFGYTRTHFAFERLHRTVTQFSTLAQEFDLLLALDESKLYHLRREVNQGSAWKCAPDRLVLLVGDGTYQANTALTQP